MCSIKSLTCGSERSMMAFRAVLSPVLNPWVSVSICVNLHRGEEHCQNVRVQSQLQNQLMEDDWVCWWHCYSTTSLDWPGWYTVHGPHPAVSFSLTGLSEIKTQMKTRLNHAHNATVLLNFWKDAVFYYGCTCVSTDSLQVMLARTQESSVSRKIDTEELDC